MKKEPTFIKYDNSYNWNKAEKFIPKENEIIIYTDLKLTKIGNGVNRLKDLPFINQNNEFDIDGDILIINSPSIQEG